MLVTALVGSLVLLAFRVMPPQPQVSPAQATAAARVYATATARQGVMDGFDAAHANWNPYETLLTPAPVGALTHLWAYKTGGVVESAPIVADGILYLASGSLQAFAATCRHTCQPLWTYEIDNGGFGSTPAVADGILYVVGESGSLNALSLKLYAFDAHCRATCQPLLVTHVVAKSPDGSGIAAFFDPAPTIAGGMLYLAFTLFAAESKQQPYGELYVFDAHCRHVCQPLWSWDFRRTIPYGLAFSIFAPALGRDMMYIDLEDALYAFDAHCRRGCQQLWKYGEDRGGAVSPAAGAGNIVYIIRDLQLFAFDADCRASCQPLWHQPLPIAKSVKADAASPVVAGSIVYAHIYGEDDDDYSTVGGRLLAFGLKL